MSEREPPYFPASRCPVCGTAKPYGAKCEECPGLSMIEKIALRDQPKQTGVTLDIVHRMTSADTDAIETVVERCHFCGTGFEPVIFGDTCPACGRDQR